MSGALVIVGDSLLDTDLDGTASRLCPDAPAPVLDHLSESVRPGGAALAAAMARTDGAQVVLVTALSEDEAGQRLRSLIQDSGIDLVDLKLDGPTPQKIRIRSAGKVICRLDRGCDGPRGIEAMSQHASIALKRARCILVADYGRGMTSHPEVLGLLRDLAPHVPMVWDPHPHGETPVAQTRLATPNSSEAARFTPAIEGSSLSDWTARARSLKASWRAANVAVTLSGRGALLVSGSSPPMVFPTEPAVGDTCGAGDRFSSAAAVALLQGMLPSTAVSRAVEVASGFVASGGVSTLTGLSNGGGGQEPAEVGTLAAVQELAASVRSRGGTVVATGGCFDLLHTGHIRTLQAARALGQCLIVVLNSDRSVSRLKGPERPLNPETERAAVLQALSCVDAVVTFDDPTPEGILAELRPDVFVKGGDYAFTELPEERILRSWGGQAVTLPYVQGRSTSALIDRIAAHARE